MHACMQDVVIIGTGAFGCEAMRAAVRNGAASVTVVTRKRTRFGSPPFLAVSCREPVLVRGGLLSGALHGQVDCALLATVHESLAPLDASPPLGLEGRPV